ncbi:MAG: L,D-transpeptidase [Saprospiraceae bacterium]|nr:L,D-transpeptidase [Saprospiraceae bacterium]
MKIWITLVAFSIGTVWYTPFYGQSKHHILTFHHLNQSITIREYFDYLDQVIDSFNVFLPFDLTEHILVHANPWILDRLVATDYYKRAEVGDFLYDQRKAVVLKKGDRIAIPDVDLAAEIIKKLNSLSIEINIPEFRLRILKDQVPIYQFAVRVGRNEDVYLAAADRIADLRTQAGSGKIVRIFKDPPFINPATNEKYKETRRDDGKITLMPLIPWLETEINGIRNGQLIHPTTNPSTLGKAYSNGCIGVKEGDAWIIYYHAPVGTKVDIKYDLVTTPNGVDSVRLLDIYKRHDLPQDR